MIEKKVVRRQHSTFATILVLAALAFPFFATTSAFAATVDVEQGKALVPIGSLDADPATTATDAATASTAIPGAAAAKTATPVHNEATANVATQAVPAKDAASQAKPVELDLRRAARDAAKPVLDDLAHSTVVDAVRGLNSAGQAADGDDAIDADAGAEAAGRRRNWDGQQNAQDGDSGNSRRARSDAEMANDKVKASFLFQALVEEVAPWAVAAAILYVVFYTARVVLALRRRVKAEKRERRMHERRRNSATSRGSPTQR